MAKKRVPAIIFNDTNFKYPKGLRVKDEDELDIKLKSGEWNTGPVDGKKGIENPHDDIKNSEKRALIQKYQDELGEDIVAEEPGKIEKEKIDIATPGNAEKPTKKPLSHMNITELMVEAEEINLTIDENWTKTDLYNAIKKKKG